MSMPFDDDSDVSTTSVDFLQSPTKAKREALKQKLKKEGLGHVAMSPSAASLQGLKLSVFRQQVAGKQDQEQKRDRQAKEEQGTSLGTKTREQELANAKGIDTHPSAGQIAKEDAVHDKQQEEIQQQEVQGEGG